MTDTDFELTLASEATSMTPEQAIGLLARNADRLEQLSRNLEQAVSHLGDYNKTELRGLSVKRPQYGDYYSLERHSARLKTGNNKHELENEAITLADKELAYLSESIRSVGFLAHKVHLDTEVLSYKDASILESLPAKLEAAQAVFKAAIASGTATGEHKEALIQFKRDSEFLGRLSQEIGDAGQIAVAHNKQLIDRQAKLTTVDAIEVDRAEKRLKGASLMTESEGLAKGHDPSYRNRVADRERIGKLTGTRDIPATGLRKLLRRPKKEHLSIEDLLKVEERPQPSSPSR